MSWVYCQEELVSTCQTTSAKTMKNFRKWKEHILKHGGRFGLALHSSVSIFYVVQYWIWYIAFAANEFSKIYYPYGIIVRRSIPTSWARYIRYRAPMASFFLMAWYTQREYPRAQRMDLYSEREPLWGLCMNCMRLSHYLTNNHSIILHGLFINWILV